MKRIVFTVATLATLATTAIADGAFFCSTSKNGNRGVYAVQSANNEILKLYSADKETLLDTLVSGKSVNGTPRHYGNKYSTYIYNNKRKMSIRAYDGRNNRIGRMLYVYNCRSI